MNILEPSRAAVAPRENHARFHVPVLDGIRGLALLMVLLFHLNGQVQYRFLNRPPTDPLTFILLRVSNFGWVGVDLFFVLSGFLITGILIDARSAPNYYSAFYARRALRIFPLYFGFVSFCLLVVPSVVPPTSAGFSSAVEHQWYLWLYVSNFGAALKGIKFGPLSHLWSLAVEEHFYLIWPVLVRVFPAKRLPLLCALCIVVAPAVRLTLTLVGLPGAGHVLMPARLDALGLGGLCAVIARDTKLSATRARFGRALLAASAVFFSATCAFAMLNPRSGEILSSVFSYSLYASASASLIWFASIAKSANLMTRLLSVRPLRVLGKYSYGMYVLHVPMVPILYLALQRLLRLGNFEVRSELAMLTLFPIFGIACVFLAAALSFHLFERPFLRLKIRFNYSDRSAPTADSIVASR